MPRRYWIALVCLMAWAALAQPTAAQTEDLTLSVRRNFGYGGGHQIQGSFRMEVTGPNNLTAVTFKVDEQIVDTLTQPPWRVDFQTDDYGLGEHTLTATAETTAGRTLTSNTRSFEFVSAEVGWQAGANIALPILGAVGIILLIGLASAFLPNLTGQKVTVPLGAPRKYGFFGGALCPKCHRPFSRHWWGLNAGLGKFDRCDHCGGWSIVRAESPARLREAEAAELQLAQPEAPVAELTAEEKLKRQLDESRFVE